jgi:DNA processing protein
MAQTTPSACIAWIALNSINGLGPARIQKLLEKYQTPEKVLKQPPSDIAHLVAIKDEAIEQLRSGESLEMAKEQIKEAARLGITILTLDDDNYPPQLKEIFAPPPVLYVAGNLKVFTAPAVGVVGTRVPSAYGERACSTIVEQMTRHGIVTVSGLARGIDTVAHRTCLDNGGATIAVLGCGLDRVYPQENAPLAERIKEKGAVVSEFPLKMHPAASNFPRRNRIISGLSAGVLVVEAGKKSGALITSSYALQQNRDVFTVPGSIFSDKSEGTFSLLKAGAVPVRSAAEIVESIQIIRSRPPMESVPKPTLPPQELLSEGERVVLEQMAEAPLRIDEIVEKSRKMISELFDILLNLELKGFVKQVAGQQFVRL